MSKKLEGLRVAMLAAEGFEQVEMTEPKKALENEGAKPQLVSCCPGKVKAWKDTDSDWGDEFPVDVELENASADDFDALLLPGGVMNPDKLRANPVAVKFVKAFVDAGKPIAAICHGPWTLIDAGGVKGHTMTSYPSIKSDLTNAGANWVDKECVRDGELVTSRKPDDLPAFNATMIELFAESCQHA